jgi:fused signal recognition particle receptor
VGAQASRRIVEGVRDDVKRQGITDPSAIRGLLRHRLVERFAGLDSALAPRPVGEPYVILVVGVNGGGKTTSIGKLAARFVREGRKVLLGAGDTYRAGAIEQLGVWAERAGADIVTASEGADPAAVLYDTLSAARARGFDTVIADTAGRLQNRRDLMDQLGKVVRVLRKAAPRAPHEVLLVLDATIGQNALSQARLFGEAVGVTGLVLTKLDGTARGGVVVAVCEESRLPIKFIGVGEKVDDLRPFEPEPFVDALLGHTPGQPGFPSKRGNEA